MLQQNQWIHVVGKTDEVGSIKVSTWSTKGTDVHDFTPDSNTRHWTSERHDGGRASIGILFDVDFNACVWLS
jgi:hypothetical protein